MGDRPDSISQSVWVYLSGLVGDGNLASLAANRLSRKCNSGAKTSNSIAWSVPGIAPPKKPGGDAAKVLVGEDHFESARAGQGAVMKKLVFGGIVFVAL